MDARGLRYVGKGAKAARNVPTPRVPARVRPEDMVGPNATGTLGAFDYRQVSNAAQSSRGLDGRTVLGALDVDEFRRARYGDKKPSDVWNDEAMEEFRARAEAGLNGLDVVPENLPRLKATVDPKTGNIRVNLTGDWDETWETAAHYADAQPDSGRRVPFELEFDTPLRGTVTNRPLSGFVEIVDDDHGGVLSILPLSELDLPSVPDIRGFVDTAKEAEYYARVTAKPRFILDNARGLKMQAYTDAQARMLVRSLHIPESVALAAVKISKQGDWLTRIERKGIDPLDYAAMKAEFGKDWDTALSQSRNTFETQRDLDDWMTIGEWGKDAKGNDVLRGGLFRHMEQRDPERYAAMKRYVQETPWTRRNVYGDDVEFPDDPIVFYHYTRDFKWNDGRQYLQELAHARETGRHLGTAEASNTWTGLTPVGPYPGDPRSMRNSALSSDKFAKQSKSIGDRIDKVNADIMFAGMSDEVATRVRRTIFKAMEDRWTSKDARNSSFSGLRSNVRDLDDVINEAKVEVATILRASGAEQDLINKVNNFVHGLVIDGSQLTGGMMTPHVVGAKRPFKMFDSGNFGPEIVLEQIALARLPGLDAKTLAQLSDVNSGRMAATFEDKTKFAQYLLERAGFDSIVYHNTHEAGPVPSIIVWRPELMKPLTESRGFDKSDPRRAAAVLPWWAGMFGEEDGREEPQ